MKMDWCSITKCGVRLAVQITPNAKKTEVVGLLKDVLKIRLQAQPIEGKANEALIRYIADRLEVPRNAVNIAYVHTNKRKIIEINTSRLSADAVKQIFLPDSNNF